MFVTWSIVANLLAGLFGMALGGAVLAAQYKLEREAAVLAVAAVLAGYGWAVVFFTKVHP